MGAFTNQQIKNTYGDVVQLGNSGAGVSASLVTVQDGLGNNLPYQVSSTTFNVSGTFQLQGSTISSASLVTASSTNTFTNKTYDTAGTGNVFKINGTTISGVNGTGNVLLTTNAVLVTPALGTPASGVLTNCTGTAAGLTSGHVTTNANLTGVITSVGNATSTGAQTGTGSTFAMQTAPTITLPVIGDTADPTKSVQYSLSGATTATHTTHTHTQTANRVVTWPDSNVTILNGGAVKSDQTTGTSTTLAVTPAVQQNHDSAVKFWVDFTASATPTINASYNVSSVTKASTGLYTINLTTAFTSANYCPQAAITVGASALLWALTSLNTSSLQVNSFNTSSVSTDAVTYYVCGFGRQ